MKKVVSKKEEQLITFSVQPKATKDDIKNFNCSCVNHLCGCKSPGS